MSTCTFFGHRQCSPELRPQLRRVLVDLIEEQGVYAFYVGNQGGFDYMVCSVLRELCQEYPDITYGVVLAYLPTKRQGEGGRLRATLTPCFQKGLRRFPNDSPLIGEIAGC